MPGAFARARPAAAGLTHELYGTVPGRRSFANNRLLARRLVDQGVRFVQLYHRGWDHHGTSPSDDIQTRPPKLCRETDQAAAALITDLKRRGPALLVSTGRSPPPLAPASAAGAGL